MADLISEANDVFVVLHPLRTRVFSRIRQRTRSTKAHTIYKTSGDQFWSFWDRSPRPPPPPPGRFSYRCFYGQKTALETDVLRSACPLSPVLQIV